MSEEGDAKNDTRDLDPVEAPPPSTASPADAPPAAAPPSPAPPAAAPPDPPTPRAESFAAQPDSAGPSPPLRPWPAPRGRVKILFLAANASAERPLRLDEEYRAVERRLRASRYRDAFELVSCWALRPGDLQSCLLEHRPTIVHFAGHGDAEAELWLLDERGGKAPLPAEALAAVFRAMSDDVRLVVLNACFAAEIADALRESVGLAVGMRSAIGDRAAIEFAGAFYEALGYGCPVREAFDLAVAALRASDPAQAGIPQLLAAPGVDPTAARFVDATPPARSPAGDAAALDALVNAFPPPGASPAGQPAASATTPAGRLAQVAAAAAALAVAAGIAAKVMGERGGENTPGAAGAGVAAGAIEGANDATTAPKPTPPPPPPPSPPGMVRIAGGSFRLGAFDPARRPKECARLPADQDCSEASHPERAREVEVAAFDLDATEVTNEAFAEWLNANPASWRRPPQETHVLQTKGPKPLLLVTTDLSYCTDLTFEKAHVSVSEGRARYPVVCVTWQGANEYCRGQGKRLPSEAEWELAAKGAAGRPFPWGDEAPRLDGVTFNLADDKKNVNREVGRSPQDRSPDGAYDLGGNVSEWVEGKGTGGQKILRGGHWNSDLCRVLGSKCGFREASFYGGNLGFRCARDVSPAAGGAP